jgi:hypothetical protein
VRDMRDHSRLLFAQRDALVSSVPSSLPVVLPPVSEEVRLRWLGLLSVSVNGCMIDRTQPVVDHNCKAFAGRNPARLAMVDSSIRDVRALVNAVVAALGDLSPLSRGPSPASALAILGAAIEEFRVSSSFFTFLSLLISLCFFLQASLSEVGWRNKGKYPGLPRDMTLETLCARGDKVADAWASVSDECRALRGITDAPALAPPPTSPPPPASAPVLPPSSPSPPPMAHMDVDIPVPSVVSVRFPGHPDPVLVPWAIDVGGTTYGIALALATLVPFEWAYQVDDGFDQLEFRAWLTANNQAFMPVLLGTCFLSRDSLFY